MYLRLASLLIFLVHTDRFLFVWSQAIGTECASPLVCVTTTEFSMCSVINGQAVISDTKYVCPAGTVCTEDEFSPCIPATTTTSTTSTTTTTTTPLPTTPTSTTSTSPTTSTSTSSSTASPTSTTSTTTSTTSSPSTTTTSSTTPVPVPPPVCTASGNHPSTMCNQYYECIKILWWYEIYVQTCPTGQAFDPTSSTCVPSSQTSCTL